MDKAPKPISRRRKALAGIAIAGGLLAAAGAVQAQASTPTQVDTTTTVVVARSFTMNAGVRW